MMSSHLYFRLYANCIPVNGKKEAAIYDLGRNGYYTIPPLLCNVLQINQEKIFTIIRIKSFFKHEFDEGIDKWFLFLENKGLGFFTDEPKLFPPLNLQWDSPFLFTNAVLEFDKKSIWSLRNTLIQLNEVGCPAIELRFLDDIDLHWLKETLAEFSDSRFTAFFIYLKYQEGIFPEIAANLYLAFRRIVSLVCHSAPEDIDNLYPQQGYEAMNRAIRATTKTLDCHTTEVHDRGKFVINMDLFTESINFHPGFNRKICIDKTGFVKNYINQPNGFGQINDVSLKSIATDTRFCAFWKLTHDQIEGCRECCYRYMCVDNAPIVEDGEKRFKHNIICENLILE